jgi:hypothetical protein
MRTARTATPPSEVRETVAGGIGAGAVDRAVDGDRFDPAVTF